MAKILLTGAAGFIGLNVYQRLFQDHEIVALDNFCSFSIHQIKLDRPLASHWAITPIEWDEDMKLKKQRSSFL